MTLNNVQQVTVKGILRRGDRILFVKDTKGLWELPGGRIEFGEDPEQTLKRELTEELGVEQVEIKELLDAWSFTSENDKKKSQFIVLVYVCVSPQKIFKKSSKEHSEYRFVPFSEINKLKLRQGYKNSINKFIENDKQ